MLLNFINLRREIYELKRIQEAETCSENEGKCWDLFGRFRDVMTVNMAFNLFYDVTSYRLVEIYQLASERTINFYQNARYHVSEYGNIF